MEKSDIKTLQDLLAHAENSFGDAPFLKEKALGGIVETSFRQMAENARKIGSFLKGKFGDERFHAAIIGPTSSEWLAVYFATVCVNGVAVPLDAQMSPEDICDHLDRSDAQVFFYDKLFASVIPTVKENCPKISVYVCLQEAQNEENLPLILASYPEVIWEKIVPESLAAILFTSGTTGKSKGVMLSHANLIDNTMCQDDESSPEESILSVLPIHHVYCFTCDILLSLRYGPTVCVNDSMMRIVKNLKLFQPTFMLLVPMIAETIYKQLKAATARNPETDIKQLAKGVFGGRLKGIYSGGAYLNPNLAQSYMDLGIPIAQGYGMTECSPRISTGDFHDPCIGSVGKIVNGCSVKIVDGEIWAKSPSVMMGYYKNPEATAEALTEDGWLKTGDLGYVDERNCIYITGRKKNLIILSNGENVSPEELENKFDGFEWLSEILVYPEDGQICAEIYPNQEYLAMNGNEDVIAQFKAQVEIVNQSVSSAKAIRRLRVREHEFIKTTSKKIKREQSEKGVLV